MKKILAVLLCALLSIGLLSVPILADTTQPATTALGFSIQSTVVGGGVATATNLSSTMEKGDKFQVTYTKEAFTWAGTTGNREIGKFLPAWVVIDGDAKNAFVYTGYTLDAATGALTLTIEAQKAFSGQYTMWLNSGAGATLAFQRQVTVKETETVDPNPSTITGTVGGTAPTSTSGTTVSIVPGDTITWTFPADNFKWSSNSNTKDATKLTDTSWIKLAGATIGTDFKVAYGSASSTNGTVSVVLTALKNGNYNNLRVYLQSSGSVATAYSPTMNVTVTSGNTGKINGISSDAQLGGKWSGAYLNGKAISDLSGLEIKSEDELLLPLDAGFFTWEGTAPYASGAVTTSQLSSGKITVGASNKKGSSVFASSTPKLVTNNGRAYVQVKFAKNAATTKDIDFSMTLYLSVNKSRDSGSQVEIAGTYVVDLIEIDSDNDYVDISDGSVVEATEYVRNIELYLGSGVTAIANLSSGVKYSGTAKEEISSSDERLMDKYSSIEAIIVLKTTGLNRSSTKITFDYSENYYVYDSNGKYLGRSNQKLAYSNKYYLSSKQIEISDSNSNNSGEKVNESNGSPTPAQDPNNPSTYNPPVNNNDNPYTGR